MYEDRRTEALPVSTVTSKVGLEIGESQMTFPTAQKGKDMSPNLNIILEIVKREAQVPYLYTWDPCFHPS